MFSKQIVLLLFSLGLSASPASFSVPASFSFFNFYTLYRWAMLGITLFNTFNVMLSILKYKTYFDRLPPVFKNYLQAKTTQILGRQLTTNAKEIRINLGLLGILIGLNIVLFFI